jgi:UDP-N-acetylmuramoyl-tripeptide--D-alanyl-D-alanine ligase
MNIEDLYKLFLEHPVISTDTRGDIGDTLFFCLKGENFDGNSFARKAVEGGAAYVIMDDPAFDPGMKSILV